MLHPPLPPPTLVFVSGLAVLSPLCLHVNVKINLCNTHTHTAVGILICISCFLSILGRIDIFTSRNMYIFSIYLDLFNVLQ